MLRPESVAKQGLCTNARLAQLVERTALNRMVVGSSPTVGTIRYGLVVRIAGFHPAGPGSIPGRGTIPCGLVVE